MLLATFKNPEFYKAQSKRISTYGLQRVICCYEEDFEHLILPRGCYEDLKKLLKENSIELERVYESYEGENIQVNFHGQLTAQQQEAVFLVARALRGLSYSELPLIFLPVTHLPVKGLIDLQFQFSKW
jgi:hypothetical protein